MLFRMQIDGEPKKEYFLFHAFQRTIFIRKRYPAGKAANYSRFMMSSVDQSYSNELMTERHVASLKGIFHLQHGVLNWDSSFVALAYKNTIQELLLSTEPRNRKYFSFRTKFFPIARNFSHNQISRHL